MITLLLSKKAWWPLKEKKSRLFTAFNEARLAVQHWLNSLLLSWTSKQFLEVEKFSPRSSSSTTTTIRCWLHCSCCSPWWCCSRHTWGGARFLCFYKSFLSLIQHWAHNTHTTFNTSSIFWLQSKCQTISWLIRGRSCISIVCCHIRRNIITLSFSKWWLRFFLYVF